MRQRKRCPYCRCLFAPDARVAKRQRACRKPTCQAERRRETQRQYQQKHPEESTARRLRAALAKAKAGETVDVPRGPPKAVGHFPWGELRDEITPQPLVVASFFVRLVAVVARDVIRAEVRDNAQEIGGLVARPSKDETASPTRAG
jgi:hypothetical protein